jgi:hypothetical protein
LLYFFGAGIGTVIGGIVAGRAGFTGAGAVAFTGFLFSSVLPVPLVRIATIDNVIDVIMNKIAEIVVAFESNVADPRGPNAVCDPDPPNAPARSAAFPLCSNTTIIRKMHTATCTMVRSTPIYWFTTFLI